MTPEEQRIAIAEACGWKINSTDSGEALRDPQGRIVNAWYNESWRLPDYLNDLNAMHEAEKVLFEINYKDSLNINYWNKIWDICGDSFGHITTVAHASASRRAEAFLRTIGKWRDS